MSIGAASVLLGTSLYLGTQTSSAHAAEIKSGEDDSATTNENTNKQSNVSDVKQVTVEKSAQTLEVNSSAAVTSDAEKATSSATKASAANDSQAATNLNVKSDATVATKKADGQATNSSAANVLDTKSTASSTAEKASSAATVDSASKESESNDVVTSLQTLALNADNTFKVDAADLLGDSNNGNVDFLKESKVNWGALAGDLAGAALKGLADAATGQLGLAGDPLKYGDDGLVEATTWDDVENAAYTKAKGVKISGQINANRDLNIYNNFIIQGTSKDATINLGSSSINNEAALTLRDITINGSINGNGTVNVDGTVNSKVDGINNKTLTDDEITAQVGKHSGAKSDNWKSANIAASTVNISQGSTLNVDRQIVGDGIVLKNGQARFVEDGTTFGKTEQVGNGGTLNVGVNSNLNINLMNSQYASRSNEDGSSLENAGSAIRAENNGHVNTGDSAQVTINAGHGRAINFNEPFGGTSNVHPGTSQMTSWYNNRNVSRNKSYAQDTNNTIVLGDSTKLNITGRDGIVMGNRSLFQTGDHSVVHIDSKGNGAGLLGDAFSKVEVSPQSQLLLTSDGKDGSGMYAGGNFIGLGENGQFRVEHDATFRYKMTNRNKSGHNYDDNMNIISINSSAKPEVYVGTNAIFDGQSDYENYYGEIFAFPLGSTNTVFEIDGAQYVNWEKYNNVGGSGHGNLYYSMGKGLIDANAKDGRSYFVFRWPSKDHNGQSDTYDVNDPKASIDNFKRDSYEYWQNVTHLATKYSKGGNTSEFPGHYVDSVDMNGDATPGQKHGNALNKFTGSSSSQGFNPEDSQRLVLVSTIIPTQEDTTTQKKVAGYNIHIRENKNLQPGQVVLVQKGQDGLVRETDTTYYNVDPSKSGPEAKTIDTSKGENGHSHKVTTITEAQDEIIEIAPQTATVNYLYDDGEKTSPIQVGEKGFLNITTKHDLQGLVNGIPVETDDSGNIIFDNNGNVTATTIDYKNADNDLSKAKIQVAADHATSTDNIEVESNEWTKAVEAGTNKY